MAEQTLPDERKMAVKEVTGLSRNLKPVTLGPAMIVCKPGHGGPLGWGEESHSESWLESGSGVWLESSRVMPPCPYSVPRKRSFAHWLESGAVRLAGWLKSIHQGLSPWIAQKISAPGKCYQSQFKVIACARRGHQEPDA